MNTQKAKIIKGSTLLQMLIIAAVIGVIFTSAVPRMQAISDNARLSSAEGNIAVIKSAVTWYLHENNNNYENLREYGFEALRPLFEEVLPGVSVEDHFNTMSSGINYSLTPLEDEERGVVLQVEVILTKNAEKRGDTRVSDSIKISPAIINGKPFYMAIYSYKL
jgi:type II secretory pathway pseudopilin PulG